MTNETKHTPAPWEVCPTKRPDAYHIISKARHWSVACSLETVGCSNPDKDISDQEALANADHIVKCVNLHDELVEACLPIGKMEVFIDPPKDHDLMFITYGTYRRVKEALKKAGAL